MILFGVIYFLLQLQLGLISCFDVSGLSMTVLKRLYSVDPKELILNPTQKQLLNEKLEQIDGVKSISCSHFDIDKNLTQILSRKEYCMRKLELNDQNSSEYANVACKTETWNKIMDCILPPVQIFTMSVVQCTLAEHRDISGIYDIVQYMMLHTFPALLNSFQDFTCTNIGVSEIVLNEETLNLFTIQKVTNTEKYQSGSLGLVLCLMQKKQDSIFRGEMSFCRKLATVDLPAIYECASEAELYDDPMMKEMYLNLLKEVKIVLLDEHKNPKLLKKIWDEVCSEESPLSKLFNDGASYKFGTKEEKTEDGATEHLNQFRGASLKTEL